MARAPTTYHLYGQPDDEYELFGITFAETRLKTPHASGFKLHVTVSTQHHVQLAHAILPALRQLHTHHKVVLPQRYGSFNAGEQAGKFITVYAGPKGPAQGIVDTIDPVLEDLRRRGVQPGPWPLSRQSNYTEAELHIGRSGMISCLWLDNLRRG